MSPTEQIYLDACCGRIDAMSFLSAVNPWFHYGDDIVDKPDHRTAEHVCEFGAMAIAVCGHPFYQQNITKLEGLMWDIINDYADSVAWEKSDVQWQRQTADSLRFCGNRMVVAVARICGGWQHARKISMRLREQAYVEHHDEKAEAV